MTGERYCFSHLLMTLTPCPLLLFGGLTMNRSFDGSEERTAEVRALRSRGSTKVTLKK